MKLNYLKILFVTILVFYSILLVITYSQLFQVFQVETFFSLLGSEEILYAVTFSLKTSVAALFLSILVGIPSAYILSREDFYVKGILESLIYLPVFLPPIVSGLALVLLFSGGLGEILDSYGFQVMFSKGGVIIAQFFIATPLAVRTFKTAFDAVDRRYEEAAATLGDYPGKIFCFITLPLAWRGIFSGVLLAWARAMGEFGATIMLAGAIRMKTETLPISIYLNMSLGQIEGAVTVGVLMLLLAVIVLSAFNFLMKSSFLTTRFSTFN